MRGTSNYKHKDFTCNEPGISKEEKKRREASAFMLEEPLKEIKETRSTYTRAPGTWS